jgi:hypothetical protein
MSFPLLWQLAHLWTNNASPSGEGEFGLREHDCRHRAAANPERIVAIKRGRIQPQRRFGVDWAIRVLCFSAVR